MYRVSRKDAKPAKKKQRLTPQFTRVTEEYRLIDPQHEQADFYRLDGDRYRLIHGGRSGRYSATVIPGFWLEADWLWQEPRPRVHEILGRLSAMS